jgi:hypothetical protein
MTRVIRSRRAPASQDLPLYARMLGLRHLAPSGFLCFVFLEGAIALGILLALAELVSWWGVLVLPATVAMMVKLNDVIAGMMAGPAATVGRRSAMAVADSASPLVPGRTPIRPAAGSAAALARDDVPVNRARTVDLRKRGSGETRMSDVWSDVAAGEAAMADGGMLYGSPASRQWADQLDVRQQIARQSAARRYE